jgi:hypothetical protein
MIKDCECPYHYDDFGCMGEGCENEGTINVPGIGYICAECYDLGDPNVQFDDTLLLIEPEAAKNYQSSLPADLKPSTGIAGSVIQTPTGLYEQPTSVNPQTAAPGASSATGTPKAKSFTVLWK